MRCDALDRLGIARIACEPAEAGAHVAAFIAAFVAVDARERATALWRRDGWGPRLSKLLFRRLDPRWCALDDRQSRPSHWPASFLRQGVYVDRGGDGLRMSLENASSASLARCRDALFSVEPGRLAVLFHHEWGVVWCAIAAGPTTPTIGSSPRKGR